PGPGVRTGTTAGHLWDGLRDDVPEPRGVADLDDLALVRDRRGGHPIGDLADGLLGVVRTVRGLVHATVGLDVADALDRVRVRTGRLGGARELAGRAVAAALTRLLGEERVLDVEEHGQ